VEARVRTAKPAPPDRGRVPHEARLLAKGRASFEDALMTLPASAKTHNDQAVVVLGTRPILSHNRQGATAMPTRLLLLAVLCLVNIGCAKRSSSLVDGDPFLAPSGSQVAFDSAATAPADPAMQGGPQIRETASVVDNSVRGVEIDYATGATSTSPPEKTEWWHTASAGQASAQTAVVMKDDIKVPESSSVNGRVGHFSVDYGMGTRIK